MRNFTIEQSEVELESNFAPRLWSLVHDVPALYEALLHELGNAGLSSADLRPDAGNGSVGSTGLALRLFGGKVNARMSLDRVYFRTSLFAPELASSVDGVTTSIRRVLPEFRFSTHTVSYACHGPIEGIDPAEFVREFVPRPPAVDGFGDHLGSGAAFYFGEAAPVISSTMTLDLSQVVHEGMFVRVLMVIDREMGTGPEIRTLVEERMRAALASVDLEIP